MKKVIKGIAIMSIISMFTLSVYAGPINSNWITAVTSGTHPHTSKITLFVETLPVGWHYWAEYNMTGGDQAYTRSIYAVTSGAVLEYSIRTLISGQYSTWYDGKLTTMGY